MSAELEPQRRLQPWQWKIASLLVVAVFVFSTTMIPPWIREYRLNSFVRAFPEAIEPYATVLEHSACTVQATVDHAWFHANDPVPPALENANPIALWEKSGFVEFADKADARLSGARDLPVIFIQSVLERMRSADAILKDATDQLNLAISDRDAGNHEKALAEFHAASRDAHAVLSVAQQSLADWGQTCEVE